MGLMSKILGDSGGTRGTEDYVELEAGDLRLLRVAHTDAPA